MGKVVNWFLFAAWVAYLSAVGPWLISANSWTMLFVGIGCFLALTHVSLLRILSFINKRNVK